MPGLDIKRFVLFSKTWSTLASGQIASIIGLFHSRKCLTGDFSSLEISFWFPLLTALSGLLPLNEHNRRRDASYFWDRCWIFSALVPVSNFFPSFSLLSSCWGEVIFITFKYLTHYFWDSALLMQHQLKLSGKTASGVQHVSHTSSFDVPAYLSFGSCSNFFFLF